MTDTIDKAAAAFLKAKAQESAANIKRLDAERRLIALVGAKDEGTTTGGSDSYVVKTVGKFNYSIDEAALAAISDKIPEATRKRLVRYTAEAAVGEIRTLQKDEPEVYAIFAEALTIKPAKTSVTVAPK